MCRWSSEQELLHGSLGLWYCHADVSTGSLRATASQLQHRSPAQGSVLGMDVVLRLDGEVG
jgi:hypothetical protein